MNKKRSVFFVFGLVLVAAAIAYVCYTKSYYVVSKDNDEVSYSETSLFEYDRWKKVTKKKVEAVPKITALCISGPQKTIKVPLQAGTAGPHIDHTIHVYMNEQAFKNYLKKAEYGVGAVIVKEKYENQEVTGIGGMIKREVGYDPEFDNWEYFYGENKRAYWGGEIISQNMTRGKMRNCAECHQNAPNNEYVFHNWAER